MYGIEDRVFDYWFSQVQFFEDHWDWMLKFYDHLAKKDHLWFQVCDCKQAKKLRKRLKKRYM